jgi:hypothetical protein
MLKDIFTDHHGRLSFTRVIGFFVITNIMLVWTVKSIFVSDWLAMDASTVGIILTVVAGKVWQKKHEKNE